MTMVAMNTTTGAGNGRLGQPTILAYWLIARLVTAARVQADGLGGLTQKRSPFWRSATFVMVLVCPLLLNY